MARLCLGNSSSGNSDYAAPAEAPDNECSDTESVAATGLARDPPLQQVLQMIKEPEGDEESLLRKLELVENMNCFNQDSNDQL